MGGKSYLQRSIFPAQPAGSRRSSRFIFNSQIVLREKRSSILKNNSGQFPGGELLMVCCATSAGMQNSSAGSNRCHAHKSALTTSDSLIICFRHLRYLSLPQKVLELHKLPQTGGDTSWTSAA